MFTSIPDLPHDYFDSLAVDLSDESPKLNTYLCSYLFAVSIRPQYLFRGSIFFVSIEIVKDIFDIRKQGESTHLFLFAPQCLALPNEVSEPSTIEGNKIIQRRTEDAANLLIEFLRPPFRFFIIFSADRIFHPAILRKLSLKDS